MPKVAAFPVGLPVIGNRKSLKKVGEQSETDEPQNERDALDAAGAAIGGAFAPCAHRAVP